MGAPTTDTSSVPPTAALTVTTHTRRWIEQFVVGLNLCPFAAPVMRDKLLHIEVCECSEIGELTAAVRAEFDRLQSTAESELATSVLVFSRALAGFDDYLDFLALAEELLYQSGLEGILQIASFHPRYRFSGSGADDVDNFTNRSPYPMLHFIREAAVSRSLKRYPLAEQIPQRNIEKLQSLGSAAIDALLGRIEKG